MFQTLSLKESETKQIVNKTKTKYDNKSVYLKT